MQYTKFTLANSLENMGASYKHPETPEGLTLEIKGGTLEPEFFRWMYNQVGKPYRWWYFSNLPKVDLQAYLVDKFGYTLMYGSNPIGFALTDIESKNSINLSYFGITPFGLEAKIKGLGTYFLNEVVEDSKCLMPASANMWVYTTSWDHPAAIPCYEKVGFKLVKTETVSEEIPEEVVKSWS